MVRRQDDEQIAKDLEKVDTTDFREVQKVLGIFDCGPCPRCNKPLSRCPFCGEKLCVLCGWSEGEEKR